MSKPTEDTDSTEITEPLTETLRQGRCDLKWIFLYPDNGINVFGGLGVIWSVDEIVPHRILAGPLKFWPNPADIFDEFAAPCSIFGIGRDGVWQHGVALMLEG